MKTFLSVHWALVAALWYLGNGILHSASVLNQHHGKYDRDLMHLLMNGHLLMLSGAVVFMCWLMMLSKIQHGGVIGIIVAAFMLLYCALIFPYLKSFGTIGISILLILVSVKAINDFPNIYLIMQKYR